jgi:hypothetical protein
MSNTAPGPDDVAFVDIPFTPDAGGMADTAIETLRNSWPDWEPADADPEVIIIEAVAPMAAEVESMAAQMPMQALITAGQTLYGIPYGGGSPAQTTVTLTFIDNIGYTVDQFGQVNIDGYAFQLMQDAVCPAGQTSISGVPVEAAIPMAAANGLIGDICLPLDLPAYVSAVSVDQPTSDGTDPMGDNAYLLLVIAKLQLRADSLITAKDFALEATLQPGVGFAWAVSNSARNITVVVADPSGQPVPASVKTALSAIYNAPDVRSVNVTYTIADPTYTTVNVDLVVTAVAAQDPIALGADLTGILTDALSPASSIKDGSGMIYKNVLVARVGADVGVYRVETLTLSSPTSGASVTASGDVTMAGGIASLPEPGTINVTVHTLT